MLRIKTGDASFDALVNGRLLYQTYSARIIGRTGFWQCGGAFGFRDQLQDAAALAATDPECTRNMIIKCASRQFKRAMCSTGGTKVLQTAAARGADNDKRRSPLPAACSVRIR